MSSRKLQIFALAIAMVAMASYAEAKWFKKEKKEQPSIENYEPPSETAEQDQCEPIREKVVSLNKHTPKYLRIFIVPRREYLTNKHRQCKAKLMDQEFQYLKHVDIKNPSLESLPKEEEAPKQAP